MKKSHFKFLALAAGLVLLSGHFIPSFAAGSNPVTPVLLQILVILIAAKIGGDIAIRLNQPEVLGELVVGIILGNAIIFGFAGFEGIKSDGTIEILSELGVILLLFEVGLETSVGEMLKVGWSALFAAILGVVVPFAGGYGVSMIFLPEASPLIHAFIGATLCATSVGITARVLKDIGKISTKEAKIILGAAVIDDVLGLLVLAIVAGVISSAGGGEALEGIDIAKIIFYAFGFLIGAVVLGRILSPVCFQFATMLRGHGLLLATSLVICFGLSYLAAVVGLAPIVGAFTAGLILEQVHYSDLASQHNNAQLEELIHPLTSLLVPIFFVVMGARVDVTVFGNLEIIWFALALTVAAIIGKQVCGFGVLEKGIDKIAVGLGMIPRGEVGLIFVGIGATLVLDGEPVINPEVYAAVVIMVVVTTMVTPPLIIKKMSGSTETEEELESAGTN